MTVSEPAADWRRVAAALANADARTVYAQVVLGLQGNDLGAALGVKKRERVLATLVHSGLLSRNERDELIATDAVFRDLLAQQPAIPVASGVDRFMKDGRIDRYPANQAERRELLAWIAEQTIAPGENLDEKQLNERLGAFSTDFALLRRYLVDFGLVERTRSGSSYSLPPAGNDRTSMAK